MDMTINLNTILEGLILFGVCWTLKQVSGLGASVGKLETWTDQHEKQDDDRHGDILDRLNAKRM